MDGCFFLDTVEMSSSSNGSNGPPTSISPAERAELNAAMKARLNAVMARGPVAKVGDRIQIIKSRKLGQIMNVDFDDYYVRMKNQSPNNEYKIFHSSDFDEGIVVLSPENAKAARRANIRARQEAIGQTPGGRISFNPVEQVKYINKNTAAEILAPPTKPWYWPFGGGKTKRKQNHKQKTRKQRKNRK